MDYRQWQVGNDTPVWNNPRRHIHFLYRFPDGSGRQRGRREDFCTPSGRLKEWSNALGSSWDEIDVSSKAAHRFADSLNASEKPLDKVAYV